MEPLPTMEVQAVRARSRHSPQKLHPLAVFAPVLGARSETFIRRHVRDLLPDRTVALTYESADDRDLRAHMRHASWLRARARFTWERERSRLLEPLGLEARAA